VGAWISLTHQLSQLTTLLSVSFISFSFIAKVLDKCSDSNEHAASVSSPRGSLVTSGAVDLTDLRNLKRSEPIAAEGDSLC